MAKAPVKCCIVITVNGGKIDVRGYASDEEGAEAAAQMADNGMPSFCIPSGYFVAGESPAAAVPPETLPHTEKNAPAKSSPFPTS